MTPTPAERRAFLHVSEKCVIARRAQPDAAISWYCVLNSHIVPGDRHGPLGLAMT